MSAAVRSAAVDDVVAQLVATGADSVAGGLVLATGGNLSARLPGSPDLFAVTGAGTRLDRLTAEDFAVLRVTDGVQVAGAARPSSEWRLHQRTYVARPDTGAVVHLHPEYAVLVDAVGERIRQLTLDHVAYAPRVVSTPFRANGSDELADEAARAALAADCVIMSHHGCSTLGATLAEAFRRAQNLESAARYTYRLLMLGDRLTEFPQELRAAAVHG